MTGSDELAMCLAEPVFVQRRLGVTCPRCRLFVHVVGFVS